MLRQCSIKIRAGKKVPRLDSQSKIKTGRSAVGDRALRTGTGTEKETEKETEKKIRRYQYGNL